MYFCEIPFVFLYPYPHRTVQLYRHIYVRDYIFEGILSSAIQFRHQYDVATILSVHNSLYNVLSGKSRLKSWTRGNLNKSPPHRHLSDVVLLNYFCHFVLCAPNSVGMEEQRRKIVIFRYQFETASAFAAFPREMKTAIGFRYSRSFVDCWSRHVIKAGDVTSCWLLTLLHNVGRNFASTSKMYYGTSQYFLT